MKRKSRKIDDRELDGDVVGKESEDENSSVSDEESEVPLEPEISEEESDGALDEGDIAADQAEEEASDSAPEDVSFKQSKQEAMESVSLALKQIQESKKRLKEKRRRHHEMLTEQKRKKLDRLKSKKLPNEFLKEISELSDPPPSVTMEKPEPKMVHQHFNEDQDDSGVDESMPIAERFYVVPASKAEKRPHPMPSKALEFLQETLYGRNVKRSSVTNIMDHNVKRGGLPARHFTNVKGKRKRRKHGRKAVPGT